MSNLCILLSPKLGSSIGNSDSQLFRPLNNLPPHTRRNRMCHSSSISSVVHHEHFQITGVRNNNTLESIGEDITGLLVGAVSDGGHGESTLETTTDTSINTFGFTP